MRYRAHVAFSTANDIIANLSQVHNRRKAFIYVSNGYDFNPFKETRAKQEQEKVRHQPEHGRWQRQRQQQHRRNPFKTQGNKFYQADLVNELSYLTRAANRANVTMYTIDPRGLVGMPDLDEKIDMVEWQNYVRTSQDSLRDDCGADGRLRGGQPERLRQGAEADRRRDERLLRHRLLLQ